MLRFTRWTRWTTRQATTASARGRQPQLARKRSYTSFFASGCGIGGCAWSALARGNDQQLSVRPASPGSRAPGCRLPSSPEPAPLRKKITARTRPHRTPPRFIGRHPRPPSVSVYIQCIMILSLKGCVQVVRDDTRDRFGQYGFTVSRCGVLVSFFGIWRFGAPPWAPPWAPLSALGPQNRNPRRKSP
jgi:hypothetical protein